MTMGVVLAAGQGRRLRPLTDSTPKAMLPIGRSTLLSMVLAALHSAGVTEIVVVTGYRHDGIQAPGCTTVHNRGPGNMVGSLMAAREFFFSGLGPTLVCYSDLILEARVIQQLTGRTPNGDIATVVDTDWEAYYRWRFDGGLGDAESLVLEGDYIVEIGSRLGPADPPPPAQYVGLTRFSDAGLRRLAAAWDQIADRHISMTELFQAMIGRGERVRAVPISGGWLEIDSITDYQRARQVITEQEVVPFFDPKGVAWPQ